MRPRHLHRTRAAALVIAAACAGSLMALQSSAWAGSTTPPPAAGSAKYNAPMAKTVCSAGIPTAVSFTFNYDAAKLRRAYRLDIGLAASSPDGSSGFTSGAHSVMIRPHHHGSVTRIFSLPNNAGPGWSFFADASRGRNRYEYVGRVGTLSCAHPLAPRLRAPRVTVGKVSCAGVSHIYLDSTRSNERWHWMMFPSTGGFAPGTHPATLVPGTTRSHRLTGLKPGQSIEIAFDNQHGRIDVGRYRFTNGCHR